MKKIAVVSLFLIWGSVSVGALQWPEAPGIISAQLNQTQSGIAIQVSQIHPSGYTDMMYHVALIPDLTVSLALVKEMGNRTDGPVVYNEFEEKHVQNGTLLVNLGNKSIERYFIGVAVSGVNAEKKRMFSAWRIYHKNGIPVEISSSNGEIREDFSYKAVFVDDNTAVMRFKLSVPFHEDGTVSLVVKKNSENISVPLKNLQSFPNIENAIAHANGDFYNKMALKDTVTVSNNSYVCYTVYLLIDCNSTDKFAALLINSDNQIIDTTVNALFALRDTEYENMVQTLYTLLKIKKGTVDPVYPGALDVWDKKNAQMLCAALLDQSLAHTSPKQRESENEQGIFTNYMQFMENITKNWSKGEKITESKPGFERLKALHRVILTTNRGNIIDPVWVENRGTAAEYGLPVQDRKNYAFYNGYSRLDCDILLPKSADTVCGIGVLFRISENIEMYEAYPDSTDTMNIFKNPFLAGKQNTILYKYSDNIIKNLDSNGIWVKGSSVTRTDTVYTTAVKAVRLSININSPNQLTVPFNSSVSDKDVIGTLIGGPEKSIVRIYDIDKKIEGADTLKNQKDESLFFKGDVKRVEYNENYFMGDSLDLSVVCADENDRSKLTKQISGLNIDVTINDMLNDSVTFLIAEYSQKHSQRNSTFLKKLLTRIFHIVGISTGTLGIKNVNNDGKRIVNSLEVLKHYEIEIDKEFLIKPKYHSNVKITCSDRIRIFLDNSFDPKKLLFPGIKSEGTQEIKKIENPVVLQWKEYEELVLSNTKIYLAVVPPTDPLYSLDKEEFFSVELQHPELNKKEMIIIKKSSNSIDMKFKIGETSHLIDPEITLSMYNENSCNYVYYVLGGFRVQCKTTPEPGVENYSWSITKISGETAGIPPQFYPSYSIGAEPLNAPQESNLHTVYLEVPYDDFDITTTQNGDITTIDDNEVYELTLKRTYSGSKPADEVKRTIVVRELKSNSKGDDVKMLKMALNAFGLLKGEVKKGDAFVDGWGATLDPYVITNVLDDKFVDMIITNFYNYRELFYTKYGDWKVRWPKEAKMLKWLEKNGKRTLFSTEAVKHIFWHRKDFLEAVERFPDKPKLNIDYPEYDDWINLAANSGDNSEKKFLPYSLKNDTVNHIITFIRNNIKNSSTNQPITKYDNNPGLFRKDLLKAWIFNENKDHWGSYTYSERQNKDDSKIPFQISIGRSDNFASISHSQILNEYRFGIIHYSDEYNYRDFNIYQPDTNIMCIGRHANGGRNGLNEAYINNNYKKIFRRTRKYDANTYPCLTDYTESEFKDWPYYTLIKGVIVYNSASAHKAFKNQNLIWPELLRKYNNSSLVGKGLVYGMRLMDKMKFAYSQWNWKYKENNIIDTLWWGEKNWKNSISFEKRKNERIQKVGCKIDFLAVSNGEIKWVEGGNEFGTGSGYFKKNQKITLKANPKTGYTFLKWIIGGSTEVKENPLLYTPVQNISIKAEFKKVN